MPSLLQRFSGREVRDISTLEDYVASLNQYVGFGLGLPGTQTTLGNNRAEPVPNSFEGYAIGLHAANGIVFAVMAVRQLVFSSVRFRYQRLRDGKPSDMFGTPDLRILERPTPGETTQDFLSRAIQDADLAGNAYHVLDTPLTRLGGDGGGQRLLRLRPDWVQIVVSPIMRRWGMGQDDVGQLGWERVGYVYNEGGIGSSSTVSLLPDEVSHFAPYPDPLATYRGMSWLTPVIRDVQNDRLMTKHKQRFLEQGATPNMVITHAPGADREKIIAFAKRLQAEQGGAENAGKTLNLYPGADATIVGSNLKQLDLRGVQGAGETRIAAAGGIPPVIVGLSEGLQAATYSNYGQARRRLADGTMHPLWENMAGSIGQILPAPGTDTRLWYDADDIPFLREDEGDAAEIQSKRAATINSLITAGYEPDSVIKAVDANDFRLLQHTGMYSVQLHKPGEGTPPAGGETP